MEHKLKVERTVKAHREVLPPKDNSGCLIFVLVGGSLFLSLLF